jgi:hypothetical protein
MATAADAVPPIASIDPFGNLHEPPETTSTDDKYLSHEFITWQGWWEWQRGWTPTEARDAVDAMLRGWLYQAASLARHCLRSAYIMGALSQRTAPTLRTVWSQQASRGPQYVRDELQDVWDRQWRPGFETKLRDKALLGGSVLHVHYIDDIESGLRRPVIKRWPHEAMWWRAASPGFPGGWYAITSDSGIVRMNFGDGKWILVADGERWHEFGAVLAVGELFVSGKLSERDEAGLSEAAGRASPVGVLPEDVAVDGEDGIGKAMGKTIAGLGRARTGALIPHGADVKPFQITSDTQFFDRYSMRQLVKIALAILGQTGTTVQGAGGVYTAPVFADVADALVDKDHEATVRAWNTGIARPFSEINGIVSDVHLVGERYADPVKKAKADADLAESKARTLKANADALAAAALKLAEVVKAWRGAGLAPTEVDIADLAADLGTRALALVPAASAAPGPAPNQAADAIL